MIEHHEDGSDVLRDDGPGNGWTHVSHGTPMVHDSEAEAHRGLVFAKIRSLCMGPLMLATDTELVMTANEAQELIDALTEAQADAEEQALEARGP